MGVTNPLILVVDDDDELRSVLEDTLSSKGYRTRTAANGRDALAYLRDGGQPDLMLLDLSMPEMDGWQLRHLVGGDARMGSFPIIVMTAAQDQTHGNLGVAEVIAKPFSLDQLLVVLRRHLLDAQLPQT
jgi:CheY-like chemotaxis protein